MGSIAGTVGGKFGIILPGPGVPSGGNGLLDAQTFVLTSIYQPVYPVIANTTFYYVAYEYGWRSFILQLVPAGSSVGTVQVNATLDGATAMGQAQNWESLPQPSSGGGGAWVNPMTTVSLARFCRIDSGPWVAFQLVAAGFLAGGNSYVLFGASG